MCDDRLCPCVLYIHTVPTHLLLVYIALMKTHIKYECTNTIDWECACLLFQSVDLITRDQDRDKLLRFHKMCPAMQEHTENTVTSVVKYETLRLSVISVDIRELC